MYAHKRRRVGKRHGSVNARDQLKEGDKPFGFCDIYLHQATINDDKLWIHGGYATHTNEAGTPRDTPNRLLRSIDLTERFMLSSTDAIPIEIYGQPDTIASRVGGALWAQDNQLWEIGGTRVEYGANETLVPVKIDPEDVTYRNQAGFEIPVQVATSDAEFQNIETSVYDMSLSAWRIHVLEHHLDEDIEDSEMFLPGEQGSMFASTMNDTHMAGWSLGPKTKVDINEQEMTGSLTNFGGAVLTSYSSVQQTDITIKETPWKHVAGGNLLHIPWNDKGLLIFMNGEEDIDGIISTQQGSVVHVMNLDTDEEPSWVTQKLANGPKLSFFNACTVVAVAEDKSSAQIYVYGGDTTPASMQTTGGIWALSIPSFEWFQIQDESEVSKISARNPGRRSKMTCNLYGSHMLMFGGQKPSDFTTQCETTGLYAFDLNSGKWLEEYDGAAAKTQKYEVPKQIYEVIGGDAHGGATATPVSQYADANLEKFFSKHLTGIQKNGKTASPTPGSSSVPAKDEPAGPPIGVLIGAIVCIVLAMLTLCAWFLFRKYRRRLHVSDTPLAASKWVELPGDVEYPLELENKNSGAGLYELPQAHLAYEMPTSNNDPVELPGNTEWKRASQIPAMADRKNAGGT